MVPHKMMSTSSCRNAAPNTHRRPSCSSTGNTAFKVAMAAFFVAIPIDLISATRTPKWGCALVYLSWFLLVLQSYLLLISIHEDYICTIVPVLLFAALLPWKQPSVTV